jgi:hypothetical protein
MGKRLIGSVGLKPGTDTGFDLDEKGQIHGYTDTQFALPVGTNDYVIYADSSAASGLVYGASAKSVLTTAGDLLVASGANTLSRLARGSDNYVLTMNGTSLNWEAAAGGLWTEIGNYRATTDEGLASFTSLAVDLDNDYSKVVLIMTGKSASAANGGFYLNNISSGSKYDYTQLLNDSTTVSGSTVNENVINILPSGLIDAADNYFNIQFEITFSGIADEFLYQFSGGASGAPGNIVGAGKATLASSGDELGQINVSFGGTGWQTGTQINVYKVAI